MALVVAAAVPPGFSPAAPNGAAAGPPAEISTPPEPVPVPPPEFTVQLNEAVPLAPVVSLAVTVTDDVPAVVGVPEIRPVEALIESPAGRPVARGVSVWPEAESVAPTWRLAAVPTVDVRLPGLPTVTVLPVVPPEGRFHICAAESVQASSSSCPLGLPPGSVRHSPEFGLSSSPLDSWVQFWAGLALQAYQSMSVPAVVPAATTSRQPPWVRRVPSV